MNTKEIFQTSYGLKYQLTQKINPNWSNYDKLVAETHLKNVGVIIIDNVYCQPIDNEYDLGEIYSILEQ